LTTDRDEWERLWKKASVAVIDLQDEVEKLEADKGAWEACAQGHYEALSKANKRIAALEETLIEVLVDNGRTRDEAQHIADLATGGVSEWFWER
jgi:hypothetical protein